MAKLIPKTIHAQKVEPKSEVKRVYFEDKGQDFLYWDIDSFGNVIDCGPFQSAIWIGCKLSGGQQLSPGDHIEFYTKGLSHLLRLNYAIEKSEILNKEVSDG